MDSIPIKGDKNKRIRRDNADITFYIHKRIRVKIFGVHNGCIDIRKEFEFVRAADIVTVARSAEGHHAMAIDLIYLVRLKRFDHAALFRHAANPFV